MAVRGISFSGQIHICMMYVYCRASHTGDACRGRGRERERGISSELADMTCCELHLAVVVVVVVVVIVVVVVVVCCCVVAVAAWSCCRCRCYLCSWYFLQTPKIVKSTVFCKPPKSFSRRCFRSFSRSRNQKNTVNTDVFGSAPRKTTVFTRFWALLAKSRYLQCFVARA